MTWLFYSNVAVSAGSTLLGLFIGYHAYRGFRRNDSRPMQYLSIGLLLLTAVTYTISFGTTALIWAGVAPAWLRQPVLVLARFTQFAGLAFIALSLHKRP